MHHYGNSMRIGVPAGYGGVEDCLKEAEMIVFWSCDPESTNGAYAGFEGTTRRLWAQELGIEFVHIDPHNNPTAQLLGGRWMPIRRPIATGWPFASTRAPRPPPCRRFATAN